MIVDDELDPAQQRYLENALDTRVDRPHAADPRHLRPARRRAPRESSRSSSRSSSTTCRACAACGSTSSASAAASARAARASRSSRPTAGSRAGASRCCERRLKDLERQRATRRKERQRTETPTIALAGYTNVGKSTLLNALTGSDVSVENQLFQTLDPTTRGFEHDGRRYLVTDTVGFIRRLPHQLVEGFASTLEETLVADVVLHVVDASADDDEQDRQREAVDDVLHEIGAAELPIEVVLNKIDRVDPLGRRRLANRFPGAPQVSALTGEGLDELRARARAPLRRPLGARAAARARTRKAAGSPSSTRSARRSRSARTQPTACS